MAKGFTTRSSLAPNQEPIAQAMFEIFKSGLANGLPAFPGSGASAAFNPRSVQSNFRSNVAGPLNSLYQNNFASLIGSSAQPLAQSRRLETINALGAQAGFAGERQAYQEFLRTQPSGDALNLGQALLGTTTTASFFPEPEPTTAENIMSVFNTASRALPFLAGVPGAGGLPDISAGQSGGNFPFSPFQSDRFAFGRQPLPSSDFQFDTTGLGF